LKNVYFIIPLYNEEEVIRKVIGKVLKQYPNVVCVNDGSSDSSANEVQKTSAVLVNHPINLGQGAAIQTGIEYALQDPKAEYFVTFDADGQHRLEDVKNMLNVIHDEQVDIVLGSRFLGKVENINSTKKFILKLAVRFSNKTSGITLTDTHNGLRVFNRYVAENLNITMSDFSHASEIIERIAEKEFKYKEVPVTIKYTDYSRSKGQSMYNAVNIGFDVLLRKLYR
jgi:glycosyltransferase involved in cell wall biosynthesis